jgi:hypothetical protein
MYILQNQYDVEKVDVDDVDDVCNVDKVGLDDLDYICVVD